MSSTDFETKIETPLIALLDVNLLVALFDPTHTHHEPAHRWFDGARRSGWATCPITENGLVRVLSNPRYPGRQTAVADAVGRLQIFRRSGDHTFWPDTLSLTENNRFRPDSVGSHRKLTDLYLLALAVENEGRLATFDRGVSLSAVVSAEGHHLTIIA